MAKGEIRGGRSCCNGQVGHILGRYNIFCCLSISPSLLISPISFNSSVSISPSLRVSLISLPLPLCSSLPLTSLYLYSSLSAFISISRSSCL